jgi:hypothetical protein
VKATHKALAVLAVAGLAVGGCSAVSHMRALQPPKLAKGVPPEQLGPLRAVPRPKIQLGAGIDLYTYKGQNFSKSTVPEIAYLKSLHANSVIVSFPFFMRGGRGSRVYPHTSTPSPAQLGVFARAAARAGLYVSLRPLLSNYSLGKPRNEWKPVHLRAWFASYTKFLLPYARMAQRDKVPVFYVGTELQNFGGVPEWNQLDRAIRRVYTGTLAYANNGHGLHPGTGGRHTRLSADSYPVLQHMSPRSGVSQLTRAWMAWDQVMPRGTVLSEVGIAAVRGAFEQPWVGDWPHPRMDTSVQTRWFTAACHAASRAHMGGIYFWAIGFGKSALTARPDAEHQAAWEAGPGKGAVTACFKQLRHG